jgi:hypothetical protein
MCCLINLISQDPTFFPYYWMIWDFLWNRIQNRVRNSEIGERQTLYVLTSFKEVVSDAIYKCTDHRVIFMSETFSLKYTSAKTGKVIITSVSLSLEQLRALDVQIQAYLKNLTEKKESEATQSTHELKKKEELKKKAEEEEFEKEIPGQVQRENLAS